jgi:ABC-type branched-subunit amino acid transport system substrate-binding protein
VLGKRRAAQAIALVLLLAVAGCGSRAKLGSPAPGQTDQGLPGVVVDGGAPGPAEPGTLPSSTATLPGFATEEPAPMAGTPSPRPTALRPAGRGWTGMEVYLGVITADDPQAASGSGLEATSVVKDISAIVGEVNRRGGVFGRRLVPLFHQSQSASLLTNSQAAAQETCTYFAQKVKVVAVVNLVAAVDTTSLRSCLRDWHLPLFGMDSVLHDDESLRDAGPYVLTQNANLSRLPAHWIARLTAQGYFDGGAKLGILSDDSPAGQRFVDRLADQAEKNGLTVVKALTYSGSSVGSVQRTFMIAGVTHVLMVPSSGAAALTFMDRAEQQGYRPRYALTSALSPDQLVRDAPVAQLQGAVGIGWNPAVDVDDAHDPGSSAGRACLAVLKRGGVTFSSSQRSAKAAGFAMCDALSIIVGGAKHSVRLDPAGLLLGVTRLGPGFPVSVAFGNGLAPLSNALASSSRDLHFDGACRCFAYSGPVRTF